MPRTRRVETWLSDQEYDTLRRLASIDDRPMSAVLRHAVRHYMGVVVRRLEATTGGPPGYDA